jgi:glucosyl-3-phosphoglycerate synthase
MNKLLKREIMSLRTNKVFKPFSRVVIPVTYNFRSRNAIRLANIFDSRLVLVGLIEVKQGESLSIAAWKAGKLRQELTRFVRKNRLDAKIEVRACYDRWIELKTYLEKNAADLVILEWPRMVEKLRIFDASALEKIHCNIAVLKGSPSQTPLKILVPLRGGPNAELALRLGLAFPKKDLEVIHLKPTNNSKSNTDLAFKGLEKIMPYINGVKYSSTIAINPIEEIIEKAKDFNTLVVGMAAKSTTGQSSSFGSMVNSILSKSNCTVIVARSRETNNVLFSGSGSEKVGFRAVSVIVDKWFAENTYHYKEFDDLENLVKLKQSQGVKISLALPSLNEEATIKRIIQIAQKTLSEDYHLLDEIVLMDSNSTDKTRDIAQSLNVPTYIHQELLQKYGIRAGKGEALWKSLYVTSGDLIVWADTDISNFHPRFIYGLIGPLLVNPQLQLVKGFYRRPIKVGKEIIEYGGGRVTELTARPLINMFYPELSGIIQPLAGEYAGRREALEKVPFFSGYGVEIGLLIDIFEKFGLSAIAQVDLLERIHRNQSLEALSKMSFLITQAVMMKIEKRFKHSVMEDVNKTMKLIQYSNGNYYLKVQEIMELERPRMEDIEEYRLKKGVTS